MPEAMDVRAFSGGAFAENGYLVVCPGTGTAVAVDPGAASAGMVRAVETDGLTLSDIYLTHAHLDHVEGLHRVHEAFPDASIWLHPDDRPLWDSLPQQAAMFGMPFTQPPEPTHAFEHGQTVGFGGCSFEVRLAPGHAPGHVILVAPDHGLALVGDVIFQRGIGRTDLPGGSLPALMASIREQVLTLPDPTRLYTGHGAPTTVGEEREGNPFLVPHFGGRLA
ncbi:MAG: MBL fold metallo-hydrolase [Longimicrobiales bacterium]